MQLRVDDISRNQSKMFSDRFKLSAWILTPLFWLIFFGLFFVFHPIFLVTHKISRNSYLRAVEFGNLALLIVLKMVGTRFLIDLKAAPRSSHGIIFVSNHQSLVDIPLLLWHLRRFDPKFIAKQELGTWLPSVSHALRHMGSVLIDRSDRSGAVKAIQQFGERMRRANSSAIIFPEGTRARDGHLKPFKSAGLAALMESMPEAPLVPIIIDGTWKITRWNLLPLGIGTQVLLRSGPVFERAGKDRRQLIEEVEKFFRETLLPA